MPTSLAHFSSTQSYPVFQNPLQQDMMDITLPTENALFLANEG